MTGLEPVTSALPRRCTTDCATLAYMIFIKFLSVFWGANFGYFYLTKAVRYLLRHISIKSSAKNELVVFAGPIFAGMAKLYCVSFFRCHLRLLGFEKVDSTRPCPQNIIILFFWVCKIKKNCWQMKPNFNCRINFNKIRLSCQAVLQYKEIYWLKKENFL